VKNRYPKVLIINGEPFNKISIKSVTLGNLFRDYPKKHLAMVYTTSIAPDYSVCDKYYKLELYDVKVLNRLKNLIKRNAVEERHNQNPDDKDKNSLRGSSWAFSVKLMVVNAIRSYADIFPYEVSEEMLNWVKLFKPDIIYGYFSSIRFMRLGIKLSDHFKVPIVPHFMDDWPRTQYTNSLLMPVLRYSLKRSLKGILQRSPVRLTISDVMTWEYEKRYGGSFTAFMNCVENQLLVEESLVPDNHGTIIFSYIGGLHLQRWESLREIGAGLASLVKEGYNAKILIYAPSEMVQRYQERLTIPGVMTVVGALAPADVPLAQRNADCLIHVESFDKEIRRYTKLSVSTKIPEYMAAGRPVLAFGPQEIGSMKYIEETGCGLVIGQRDRNMIINALRQLVESVELRRSLGEKGKKAARLMHSGIVQRKLFNEKLSEASNFTVMNGVVHA